MSLPAAFLAAVEETLPASRLFSDPLSTLTLGTDASFYRLIPKLVIRVESEDEVAFILKQASKHQVAVTFRAAGTSLSGQAVSDSVLVLLGDHWNNKEVLDNGQRIRLQPGVIGANANQALAHLNRKIGPDPASINAAKIGGMVANNSSGMCCGTAQNTYQTLAAMRLLLADGSCVDSADPDSVSQFRKTHQGLLKGLAELAKQTREDAELSAKIQHKYRIKNTTGLSLNALIDFTDPLDILTHLMVGSEGTLGFISSVTYYTVPDHPSKATALVVFPDVETCCQAVRLLKKQPVAAVELLDRRSLRSVQHMAGMPAWIEQLGNSACALLIESRAANPRLLEEQLQQINASIEHFPKEAHIAFSQDPKVYELLWRMRKDTFPAVGALRETGTTVIIEDVTFPLEQLAEGVNRLISLFEKYQYDEAILFGHALDGNLHFVFTQRFDQPEEVARYSAFMEEVSHLVAVEFGGSLKAEHGTGRNMAPFVELEWGKDAYQLMWRIKHLLDPQGILNPDVVLSKDAGIHLKNLKSLPAANPLIDKCIECGFCEPVCPAAGLTLSPRQRIVAWRAIQEQKRQGLDTTQLEKDFQYQGIDTCAATGLCAQRCPVGINTGDLIRELRAKKARHSKTAEHLAGSFAQIARAARWSLVGAELARKLLGAPRMHRWTQQLHQRFNSLPVYLPATPKAAQLPPLASTNPASKKPRVVYFAACVSNVMGPAHLDKDQTPLRVKTQQLLEKAGFEVIYPEASAGHCCGQPFASKGYPKQADDKLHELEEQLLKASRNGQDPIYSDTSPCTLRLLKELKETQLKIYDSAKFLNEEVLPRLKLEPLDEKVAVHITCGTQHLNETDNLLAIAKACATQVIIPEGIHCCGFAGDKGFTLPALNQYALRNLAEQVEPCTAGFSTSRTCEVGLSSYSSLNYQHLVYLVDKASRVKY
ncbi:FAD-binding and (Fe-S)-binding domain-containing protein [Marinospirillum minutulum]|uniref:FAD-binding and (Fe-S)-binding domain-containing protein n=1 Tax=Marinospirillum minutulum TaxID=64974 RepID=UPI00040FD9C5|nr:FAD-binding and (Fe-S)-binding domain-containing protein [Marinospirillum minutulum]